jgi:steroid 5-alpha reductase family enzyme
MISTILTVAISVASAAAVAWAGAQGGAMVAGLPVIVICCGLAFAVQWIVFVPSFLKQTEHFYDLTGSATYLGVTWLAVLAAGATHLRGLLLAAAVSAWALRLGSFLFRRVKREGNDGRFDEIKPSAPRFFVAWTLQGLWVFLTLSAALAAICVSSPAVLGLRDGIGGAVWAIGFVIEVVADRQKSAFRRRHPDRFIDTGLWAWSRHPNYFGEILLWTGIAIVASSTLSDWQWITMISPVFVALLLTKISGVPMLEARAEKKWGDCEDYRAYRDRTPLLVPWPPRPA